MPLGRLSKQQEVAFILLAGVKSVRFAHRQLGLAYAAAATLLRSEPTKAPIIAANIQRAMTGLSQPAHQKAFTETALALAESSKLSSIVSKQEALVTAFAVIEDANIPLILPKQQASLLEDAVHFVGRESHAKSYFTGRLSETGTYMPYIVAGLLGANLLFSYIRHSRKGHSRKRTRKVTSSKLVSRKASRSKRNSRITSSSSFKGHSTTDSQRSKR